MPNPNVDRNHGVGRQASDRNRDAGADPDAEGMPDVMDDTTPGRGDVPAKEEPEEWAAEDEGAGLPAEEAAVRDEQEPP